ncbi:MbtH family protein [Hamadaea tsunoensis]|uniref:MbtH family protein n=1 Tax=Hamadaea tsunoensis TaxID=53368 RepID=UPI000423BDAC|nr:MbtH family NRPS accessory protein [Hamadaea tsunoensis]
MPDRRIDEDEELLYFVVMNAEEQYSVWPAEQAPPAGWATVGVPQGKQLCLDHIERVWTDMRPLSLRRKMGEA